MGAQILLGFQLNAVFQPRFERLADYARWLDLAGLALMSAAVACLIAPAPFHRWTENGVVIDNRTLGPADVTSFSIVEDNPGRWFYHCHVFSHLHMGMNGWYLVSA